MIPLHIADQAVAAVEDELAKVKAERDQLKAEVERLTKATNEVNVAWSVYENGLIETPEWVKRSQVRDAVSRLWNAAKGVQS